ncbi:MAG: branched-chain amino acid ABC transporter permease, partial [bacterium]|nr:branched-chain amino acid ABC transporter permease [bacterium]
MEPLVAIQLLNGVVLGMIYALVAAGLTLIFGMLDIPNFAHGAFYALGAY